MAGFLTVEDDIDAATERVFRLPLDYAGILVEDDDPAHVAPFAHMVVGIARVLPEVVHAYRTGTGVDYHKYGPDFRHGQSGINRPAFLHDLTAQWLSAIPDLHQRLKSGPEDSVEYRVILFSYGNQFAIVQHGHTVTEQLYGEQRRAMLYCAFPSVFQDQDRKAIGLLFSFYLVLLKTRP